MEIRQIEAFAAVHQSGSVTAAARLLDRSQPVVSRQLQDLEQELGFQLFVRTRPQVTLTEQGRQFLEEARHVLAGLNHLEVRSREIAAGKSRSVRVAASLTLGAGLMPVVMARQEPLLRESGQQMQLDVLPAKDIVQCLIDGHADVAFTSLPVDLGRCHLHWCAQAPSVIAVPANHPLADQQVISSFQLLNETVITLSNATRMHHRLATALLHPARPANYRQIIASNSLSAMMMVGQGAGFALADPCLAALMHPHNVVFRKFESYVPYTFGAVSYAERSLSDEVLALVEEVRNYAFLHVPGIVEGDKSGIPVITPVVSAGTAFDRAEV